MQKILPFGESITREFNRPPRFILGVDFRMHNMRLGKQVGREIMNMRRKGAKSSLIAEEAMDVYQQ